MRARICTVTVLAVGALFLAGCGSDGSSAESGDESSVSAAGSPSVRPGPAPSGEAGDRPGIQRTRDERPAGSAGLGTGTRGAAPPG